MQEIAQPSTATITTPPTLAPPHRSGACARSWHLNCMIGSSRSPPRPAARSALHHPSPPVLVQNVRVLHRRVNLFEQPRVQRRVPRLTSSASGRLAHSFPSPPRFDAYCSLTLRLRCSVTRATEAASEGAFGSRSDDDGIVSCAANAASAWFGPFGSHRTAHLGMPLRSETAWWLRRRAATSGVNVEDVGQRHAVLVEQGVGVDPAVEHELEHARVLEDRLEVPAVQRTRPRQSRPRGPWPARRRYAVPGGHLQQGDRADLTCSPPRSRRR